MIDFTHDPELKSWVQSANSPKTDFPIQNLPYGTFRPDARDAKAPARLGVAIGDQILDINSAFGIDSMLSVMSMPAPDRIRLRHRISAFLSDPTPGCGSYLTPLSASRNAPPLPDRRLHRLLRLDPPRHQCRPPLPAR